jgi:hypothetical protein
MPVDVETRKCCQGAGAHEEWCWRFGQDSAASQPKNPDRAKRIKRQRHAANRRERVQIAARARLLPEVSERAPESPSRINSALARVIDVINARLQSEQAWREVWK